MANPNSRKFKEAANALGEVGVELDESHDGRIQLWAWGDSDFPDDHLMSTLTDDDLEPVASIDRLDDIRIIATRRITGSFLKFLPPRCGLQTLHMFGVPTQDEHLRALPPWAECLKSLRLTGSQVGNEGLFAIRQLHMLEELHLYGPHVTDAGMRHLLMLPKLDDLELNVPLVTKRGAHPLLSIPTLDYLIVSANLQPNEADELNAEMGDRAGHFTGIRYTFGHTGGS